MPLYVYQCKDCGKTFEKLVAISASSQTQTCPDCASVRTQKKIATTAYVGKSGSSGGGCGPAGSKFT